MTDGGVSLHRDGHGEVGGPCQGHLAGGQQVGEYVAVGGTGQPDPGKKIISSMTLYILHGTDILISH